MTKEDLIILVDDSLKIIECTISQCNFLLDTTIEQENSAFNNVKIARNFTNQIKKDLIDDIIPTSYYSIISNYMEEMGLKHLPFKELVSEVQFRNIDKNYFISTLTTGSIKNALWRYMFYNFLSDLQFVDSNTVIVGANGSGKSSLANRLIHGISEKVGIVIPSQKLLVIPTFDSIPNYSKTATEFDSFQKEVRNDRITYTSNKQDDYPYETMKIASEFNIILRNLIAERSSINNSYCDKVKSGERPNEKSLNCTLDKAIEIWNSLIEHRVLFCDKDNNLKVKVKNKEQVYPAYQMSDGEKVILYLIARVVLAPKDGFIIIDEPELYLHRAIVDKLWNQLELERQDCIFIYLTHDLDFASNRIANKFWIKLFQYPEKWVIEPIPENEIPQNLLMELLGSQKKILFCEGENSDKSLDLPIYECLFPNLTIRAVRTCKDVIDFTKSFNAIPNKNTTAFGLIDRDFRSAEQLKKLKTENVFSFNVAEVENLFLIDEFIKAFVEYKNETCDLDELKDQVIEKLENDKEIQVSNFVSNKINFFFKESHVKKGNSKSEVISLFQDFQNEIKVEDWYSDRKKEIEAIVNSKDYDGAIMVYNNKGLHSVVENKLGYKSCEYRAKALSFLQNSEEARNILREKFPKEIIEESNL